MADCTAEWHAHVAIVREFTGFPFNSR